MESDNPAQRLYDLLERAMDGKTFSKERSCRDVWSVLLDTKDTALLMARLGKVMALPAMVLEAVEERHPGDRKHHTHWVHQLSAAFAQQNLDGQWQTFRSNVPQTTLASVAMAASALREPGKQVGLSDDERRELLSKLEAMRESAFESDLPDELKRYLLQQLRKMQVALEEYFVTGAIPVLELVEATIGHFAVRHEGRSFFKTDDGQAMLQGLGAVAAAVTIAKDLPQLIYSTAAILAG